MKVLLEVKNLKKYYPIKRGLFYKTVGWVKAVDGVSFYIEEGKTLGIVGESGCGKSTLAKAILRLIEPDEGSINFNGKELTDLCAADMRNLRKDLQIIFQDPINCLDPRFKVYKIIQEGLLNFTAKAQRGQIYERVKEFLKEVGLPEDSLGRLPHEFSGGQRQRISIARSLILNPKLLVLDEPVSSLDVTIASKILDLLGNLQKKFNLTFLFISHDLRVVERISDNIAVMYLGKIVEIAPRNVLYKHPFHPYTEALISAIPEVDPKKRKERIMLKGSIPSPANPPSGCRFHTRCKYAKAICKEKEPQLTQENNRSFACHFPLR